MNIPRVQKSIGSEDGAMAVGRCCRSTLILDCGPYVSHVDIAE